jgi:excinuclease UvrABC ATPase subunit
MPCVAQDTQLTNAKKTIAISSTSTVSAPSALTSNLKPVVKPNPTNLSWKNLSSSQQKALSPLAADWDNLSTNQQSKWLEISHKFIKMNPSEQNRVQERMRAWITLTPEQRRVARESYQRTKRLNTDQKSEQWHRYQQLPDEQKKKLAAEAAKNKVATMPLSQSKTRTIPPLKTAHPLVLPLPPPTIKAPGPAVTSQPALSTAPSPARPAEVLQQGSPY